MRLSSKTAGVGLLLSGVLSGAALAQATMTGQADTTRIANSLVNQCAGIRPGELVWIGGGTQNQALLEDIAVEVRKLGAHPIISIGSDRLNRKLVTDVSPRFDAQEPVFALKMADVVDAVIHIEYSEKPDLLSDIAPERLATRAAAMEAVGQRMLDRNVIQVELGNGLYPSKAVARQFGIPLPELTRIFWKGVNADYEQLQTVGEGIRSTLAPGRTVQITAPNGTDLTFEIAGRPIFVSDGVVSADERYEGGPKCQVWLPAGEVYAAPVPGTAKGKFIADTFFFEGKKIAGFTLDFNDGKLTRMSAKGDIAKLQAEYDAAPAGRDVFAVFDIGINPNVKAPAGSDLVTWMGAGTISVGIGNNRWAGGKNDIPYGLFAHLPGATLTVDGKTLVEDGQLLMQR